MNEYNWSNGVKSFTASDYVFPTPDWCVIGSNHRGFDPNETRWIRKSRKKEDTGC